MVICGADAFVPHITEEKMDVSIMADRRAIHHIDFNTIVRQFFFISQFIPHFSKRFVE
jgi:hypothetical protein